MKHLLLVTLGLLGLCTACETGGAHPRPPSSEVAVSVGSLEEQVKALSSASRPGPRHAALAPLVGEWQVVLSSVSSDGKETELFSGNATLGWVLGGRFLRWETSVDFKGTAGSTTGFLGFDPRLDQYELLMISDLAQAMEVARGTGDLSGQGLVFTLEQLDPRSGARVRARSRLRSLEHDHFVLQQLEPDASGTEHVTRVWHYRRRTSVTR